MNFWGARDLKYQYEYIRHVEGYRNCISIGSQLVTIITYNVQSVLSEDRFEALLEEIADIHWDVLVLVETWREAKREEFTVGSGHHFYGSGGLRGRCGIGFLVNKRHERHSFVPVDERLAFLDVKLVLGRCRIFGVYFPDSGHPDSELDIIYEKLDARIQQARRRNTHIVLAGDFNAQVGHFEDFDDERIIGKHGFGLRSDRGERLLRWCAVRDFVLTNTHFEADADRTWTYRNGCTYRQLDYILVDRFLFARTVNSHVKEAIDIGSPHRAVEIEFLVGSPRQQYSKKRKHICREWAVDVAKYKQALDDCFCEFF